MKNHNKNVFGFAHHAVLGLVVIGVVTGVGVKVLAGTHALTETDSAKKSVWGYVHRNGSTVANAYLDIKPWTIANSSIKTNSAGYYKFYSSSTQVTVHAFKDPNHCLELTSQTYKITPTLAGTRQDFALTKSHPTCWANGFVKDKYGNNASYAIVTLKDNTTSSVATQKTGADASFSLPLTIDNSYSLSASLKKDCKQFSSDPTTFTVGSGWANPPMYLKLTNTKSTC